MREILFRGKDLQNQNGWLIGFFYKSDINKRERTSGKATLIFTPDCDTFIYVPQYHNSWMVHADTVGQYTGLKDKNSKRIFEGDILKVPNWDCYGKVQYAVPECRFEIEMFDNGYCVLMHDFASEVEVIGNIHDNPELLEE